jgi:hypothetical protein
MSAAEALKAARAAGVHLGIDGDDLVLEASTQPPAAVLDALSRHKAEIVATASIYYTGGGGGGGGGAVEPTISMNPVTDKAINAVTYCIDMMLEKILCSDYPPEQLSRDMEIVTELREIVHTLNDLKD